MSKLCLISCKASDRHLDYFNCRLHECITGPSYLFVNLNETKNMKKKKGSTMEANLPGNQFIFLYFNKIKRFVFNML